MLMRISAKQRRIYQSSWITWPSRLWLLWGIVLWKETLCKTWIVFILIKCICFIYNQNHSCVKSRQKHGFLNKKQKTHCFPTSALFIPLFWNENVSLVAAFSFYWICSSMVMMPHQWHLLAHDRISIFKRKQHTSTIHASCGPENITTQ